MTDGKRQDWGAGHSHGADALLVRAGLAVRRLLVQVLLADLALARVRLPAAGSSGSKVKVIIRTALLPGHNSAQGEFGMSQTGAFVHNKSNGRVLSSVATGCNKHWKTCAAVSRATLG